MELTKDEIVVVIVLGALICWVLWESRTKLFDHQKDELSAHTKDLSSPTFWEQGTGKGRGAVEPYGDDLIMCIEDQTEDDYTVGITDKDGNHMRILIPKDFNGNKRETRPYGLNMISEGHYW